jgi:hypothetical protein
VGHSTGLLLVGITLIVLDYRRSSYYEDDHPNEDETDLANEEDEKTVNVPDLLSQVFESLVGVFMIVLGLYGVRHALYHNRTFTTHRNHHPSPEAQDDDNRTNVIDEEDLEEDEDEDVQETQSVAQTTTTAPATTTLATTTTIISGTEVVEHEEDARSTTISTSGTPPPTTTPTTTPTLFRHLSIKFMAFLAGIVHGLAGPGGVLGVIPAVQLKDWKLACIYLSSFCITSTLTMGCFACLYGKVTSSCGGKGTNIEFRIQCGSAGLSILVGITWLVLSSLGQLDAVFH